MDCSQHVLDAAEKGLPEPQVLEYLRKMSSGEAVQHYNSVVARVRGLLHQAEQGQTQPQRSSSWRTFLR